MLIVVSLDLVFYTQNDLSDHPREDQFFIHLAPKFELHTYKVNLDFIPQNFIIIPHYNHFMKN